MLKKDLILRNPLRLLGNNADDVLSEGGFGAVLARAGVGKTAFLIQLALYSQLRNKNILHVSLEDPVQKVNLWYEEVFRKIGSECNVKDIDPLWHSILPHRFIMTFKVEGFSVPKLEERLTDLTEQNIFSPQMLLIDGLPFSDAMRSPLLDLKKVAKRNGMHVWFTVRIHRHEMHTSEIIPPPLSNLEDLFEVIIQLQPEANEIYVKTLKGMPSDATQAELLLDPSTMLLKGKE
jgi:hypothetical protein